MDKKLTGLLVLLVLIFSLFISYTVFNKQIATFTRASSDTEPSAEKSLIFAWPLTAKANGQDKVMINIFIRNEKNQPLASKLVTLSTNLGQFDNPTQITDKTGKISFYLTSNQTGIAEIKAIVDKKIQLNQSVTIKFE